VIYSIFYFRFVNISHYVIPLSCQFHARQDIALYNPVYNASFRKQWPIVKYGHLPKIVLQFHISVSHFVSPSISIRRWNCFCICDGSYMHITSTQLKLLIALFCCVMVDRPLLLAPVGSKEPCISLVKNGTATSCFIVFIV